MGVGECTRRQMHSDGSIKRFLVSGFNFNWTHKSEAKMAFLLFLVSSSNELWTESAEVKLVEKLQNPLIYYRLFIGIVSPRPDSSP